MQERLAPGAALALALSLTAVAWAQAPGAGSPAAGQGLSGPPGSQSAGDPAKPPGAPTGILPRSFTPAPRLTETADAKPFRGWHRISGEVLKLDQGRGWVTLRTDMGDMDLHFPPGALQGIKEGDRVEVQLGLRPSGTSHSQKSP